MLSQEVIMRRSRRYTIEPAVLPGIRANCRGYIRTADCRKACRYFRVVRSHESGEQHAACGPTAPLFSPCGTLGNGGRRGRGCPLVRSIIR